MLIRVYGTVADDTDVLWGEWRLNDDPIDPAEDNMDHIGRSPVGPNDDYMLGT
jgi:hypothetical protein